MQTTLAAIAVVTVGYIFAYLLFDRLRDRYGYVGGAEYVIIGFLLGPQVSGLLNAGQVQDLTPIVSLALGWLGMLLGTYFRLPTMALIEGNHLRIAFAEAVATFLIAGAALLAVFRFLAGASWTDAAAQAVTLGAVATLTSPVAVDAVVDRIRSRSRVPPVLQLTARIDALIAVVAFGLVLAVLHRGQVAPGVRPPTATEWAVINVAVGVASGVLFHLFLGPRGHLDEGRLFVALAGAIVVASGASYYLNLSPDLHQPGSGLHPGEQRERPPRCDPPAPLHRAPGLPRAAPLRRRRLESRLGGPALHRAALRGRSARRPDPRRPAGRTARGAFRAPHRWARAGPAGAGRRGVAIALNYGQVHPDLNPAADPECHAPGGSAVRDRRQPRGGYLCRRVRRCRPRGAGASAAASPDRMIRRLVVLALLIGGAVLLEPLRVPTEGVIAPRSLFLFGILLLTADTFGALAHDLGFPDWSATW